MTRKTVEVRPGDAVEVGGIWNMKGIVIATKGWYIIKGHLDVSSCMVAKKDVLRVIKRGAVDPKYIPYLKYGGLKMERD
jgi:hypothetical protein